MALVRLCTCANSFEAHLIQQALEQEGIAAVVVDEHRQMALGALPYIEEMRPKVLVQEADVQRAAQTIEGHRQSREHQAAGSGRSAWICPECSERVEGQFTVCWNCQAARPEGQENSAAGTQAADGTVPATLAVGLPCVSCGYDIRGLPLHGRCPECGVLLAHTALAHIEADEDAGEVRAPFAAVARRIQRPLDAVLVVARAWIHHAEPGTPVNGRQVAATVYELLRKDSTDEEDAWHIARLSTGDDIACILVALGDADLVPPADERVLNELRGVGALLPEEPERRQSPPLPAPETLPAGSPTLQSPLPRHPLFIALLILLALVVLGIIIALYIF